MLLDALKPPSERTARNIEYGLIAVQIAAGFLHEDPKLWFECFATAVVYLFFGSLASAFIFQAFSSALGWMGLAIQLQTSEHARPTLYTKEVLDTFVGFGVVVGAMAAWPIANHRLGYETALRSSLDDCVPAIPFIDRASPNYERAQLAAYMVKMGIGFMAADAYNYWKHRYFHHKVLWPFHKVHHSHHNPSSLAGFAVSPMYGFATFVPVYLFTFPSLGLYLPVHWPVLVFYGLLNHYLHCGYVIPAVEWALSPFMIMTSAWHNVHHEKGRVGFNYNAQTFGEMLWLWDWICGTYAKDHYLYAGGKKVEKKVDTTVPFTDGLKKVE